MVKETPAESTSDASHRRPRSHLFCSSDFELFVLEQIA
jgi:hypothetical protein